MVELELIGELLSPSLSASRRGEPVTVGVPLPAGACASVDRLGVIDTAGRRLTRQARCLDRWPDGSVRWALLDFRANCSETPARWKVSDALDASAAESTVAIALDSDTSGLPIVNTGAARFTFTAHGAFPFQSVTCGGVEQIDRDGSRLELVGDQGLAWQIDRRGTRIEDTGPLRTTVVLTGDLQERQTRKATLQLRMVFFAGLATVRFELMIRNPQRAQHPNGYWDLGDPGSVYVRQLSFRVASLLAGQASCSVESGLPLVDAASPLSLHQASSGGENWNSPAHVTADGSVALPYQGYHMISGQHVKNGLRATPIVAIQGAQTHLAAAMPHFWQNFPKGVSVDGRSITLDLFPNSAGSPHELQGGEQKTHVFWISFGGDSVTDVPLEWCREPLRVRAAPMDYSKAGAIPGLVARHEKAGDYERLIEASLEGGSSFLQKRERIDEYGWRHFGEIYADHEAVNHQGPVPLVSHYNNQYDAIAAFAMHFMRTGDWRWWTLMDDLAHHVVDIDIYHTNEDRAAYNGGMFWHTNHYTSAGTATHRSYSRRSRLPGGGPSNEHNYTTGLMLHHFLTGSWASAEAVTGLARWVISMDDGRQSRFRWIDRGPTGLATATRSPDYQGPGRGAANSINALIDAHRLTGPPALLAKAEEFVRRCVHPRDDPAANGLLDAENRWSYIVFLQVLGKYLEHKRELGQRDAMYHYTRISLIKYAVWMAEHETPFLDRADRLEFPTETWAAQDLRKADILHLAAGYVEPKSRSRLIERRDAFFAYAVDALAQMPTAALTRPLILLLGNGSRVAFGELTVTQDVDDHMDFPRRTRFLAQRQRVVRRLALVALAGLAALGLMLAYGG